MSLIVKIVVFAIFVVLFFYYGTSTKNLARRMQRAALSGTDILWVQLIVLLSNVFLFGSLGILGNFFDWQMVLIIAVTSHAIPVLTWLARPFIGKNAERSQPRTIWAYADFVKNHTGVGCLVLILAVLTALVFLSMTGYAFFTCDYGSPELTRSVFQYMLLLVLLGSIHAQILVIPVFASENLNPETRLHVFVSQIGSLFHTGLLLSLTLWAFGFEGVLLEVPLGDQAISVSPQLLAILIAFFVASILLPYVMGIQRARNLHEAMNEKKEALVKELRDLFTIVNPELAAHVANFDGKLAGVLEDLKKNDPLLELDGVISDDLTIDELNRIIEVPAYLPAEMPGPGGATLTAADMAAIARIYYKTDMANEGVPKKTKDEALENAKDLIIAYAESRGFDPRVKHFRWVMRLQRRVAEISASLQAAAADADRLDVIRQEATQFCKDETEDLQKDKEGAKPAWGAIASLFTVASALSPVLIEVAKQVVQRVLQ